MGNKLTDKTAVTTQPTHFAVIVGGAVKLLTWAGFTGLADALYAAIGHDHDADYAPISHAHSAGDITSGTLDVARLPVLYSGVQVVSSGGIADLSGGQQTTITQGAVVTTTDGRRWVYSGSGSKTSEASYIELGDVSPTWEVVAGKPSTFTPSAHASAHASGGGDAIKLDDLAAPDDNTDLDATTGAHGLMSKADKSKLNGIESAADVTDAGNVGAAIHGASEKTTPVNADKIALIDSEASNVLKWLSWTNVKATLKTYFDTLYAAMSHTHAQSDITGLVSDLSGKAASSHTHALSALTQSGASSGQVAAWNGSAWAPATPSGGGGAISLTGMAFIDTTSGDDGTGVIGDPAHPYETMLAAYQDGARLFHLSPGTHAGIDGVANSLSDINIRILGAGSSSTIITLLRPSYAGSLSVTDLGRHSFYVTTAGVVASADLSTGTMTLRGVHAYTVLHRGGTGNPSTVNPGVGQAGGNAGPLLLEDCLIDTDVDQRGGDGGVGDDTGTNGGPGGYSVAATLRRTRILGSAYLGHGNGGSSVDATGGAGNNSALEHLIDDCYIASIYTTCVGGVGGSANGNDGADANLNMRFSRADLISFSFTGGTAGPGTLLGHHNFVPTISGDPTITSVLSHINGVAY